MLLAVGASTVAGLSGTALMGIVTAALADTAAGAWQAAAFFSACLVLLVSKAGAEITVLHLTQAGMLRLRLAMCHKMLVTPLKKLQALGNDGLFVILTRDIDACTAALPLMPGVLCNTIVVIGCLGYLAWLAWQVFIVLFACMAAAMAYIHFAQRRPRRQMHEVRNQVEHLYKHVRNMVDGSKELQLNAQRGVAFVDGVIAPAARQYRHWFINSMTGYAWLGNTGSTLFYLLLGLLMFVLPAWLPQPHLASVAVIVLYIIRPISDIMAVVPTIHQATIALESIERLDASLTSLAPAAARPAADPFPAERPLLLELRNVCHQYPGLTEDCPFTLGPINYAIRRNEILFIAGGNGSGKTTLAMLILGLFQPEAGQVLFNGVPVRPENIGHYRQRFSAVFADFHLFEQLCSPSLATLHQEASHYIEAMGLAHKVQVIDGKFSTTSLSTGQRKRLALISAYLEDRPVYLFDEWAADQDPVFRRVFYAEILPDLKARGKTVIVITHDDAYFAMADRVIKLEHGRITEDVEQAPVIALRCNGA
jgi:putative pyoverdin transport system ATP-binding/permease protein